MILRARAVPLALATFGAVLLLCTALVARPGAPAGATTSAPYDLAVGGSGSVGFQPTLAHPHGQPTDSGYADDLAARESSRWPGLTLVRIGCPGTTTQEMISGGRHCAYREGSQLQDAVAFLHTHPSTVLVTIDLGFNDLVRCLHHMEVQTDCVDDALAAVHAQLPEILSALRQAAPAGTLMVGVGHYDPYLGDEVHGAAGQAFAAASVGVITRLDEVLGAAYAQAGIPMAEVGTAFDLGDTAPLDVPGLGTVPTDVARVCALTWMCAAPPLGPNTHPNDAGYRVISDAIVAALDPLTSR